MGNRNAGEKMFMAALMAKKFDPQIELVRDETGMVIASRIPPGHDQEVFLDGHTGLLCSYVVAMDYEEAREAATQKAIERYPQADGWECHTTCVGEITREWLESALGYYPEEDPAAVEDQSELLN